MTPDHICLVVKNFETSKDFYMKFFKAREKMSGEISSGWFYPISRIKDCGGKFCILEFPNSDFHLELLEADLQKRDCHSGKPVLDSDRGTGITNGEDEKEISNLFSKGFRHLAFSVENSKEIFEKLKGEKVETFSPPMENPWGKKMFYFLGPDGEILEIAEYPKKESHSGKPVLDSDRGTGIANEEVIQEKNGIFSLFSDGGSRGNPGIAGAGFVIFDENKNEIFSGKKFLGIQTNNFAEYTALFLGLEKAKKLGIKKLKCFLDSELVVKQLNGIYKMKNPDLKVIFEKIISMKKDFDEISFSHVYREKNKRADALANEAMDKGK